MLPCSKGSYGALGFICWLDLLFLVPLLLIFNNVELAETGIGMHHFLKQPY